MFDVGCRRWRIPAIINSPTIRTGALRCLVGPHCPIDLVILVEMDCVIPRLSHAIEFPDKTRDIPTLVSVYVTNNAFGFVALFFRVIPVVKVIRVQLVDDIGPAELLRDTAGHLTPSLYPCLGLALSSILPG